MDSIAQNSTRDAYRLKVDYARIAYAIHFERCRARFWGESCQRCDDLEGQVFRAEDDDAVD